MRVFSGYSCFPHPYIPVPLYPRVSCHDMSGDDGHVMTLEARPPWKHMHSAIATHVKHFDVTVNRYWNQLATRGDIHKHRDGSGRPRHSTPREDRHTVSRAL
ncbi:hypothetical protein PR048_015805 [Dryococelus australis]|uniref:Uncharacterized protein n=1 Tax=Dryococelus australis TaxID=614101 RepID=A0ABQ9HHY5_9NEOP|nr:hypothetical protein PR048_015805 [Dryococelus australis]